MFNKSIEYCTVLGSSNDQDDVDSAQFNHRSVILNDVKLFRLLILSIKTFISVLVIVHRFMGRQKAIIQKIDIFFITFN